VTPAKTETGPPGECAGTSSHAKQRNMKTAKGIEDSVHGKQKGHRTRCRNHK
jgi:hypothetical protein